MAAQIENHRIAAALGRDWTLCYSLTDSSFVVDCLGKTCYCLQMLFADDSPVVVGDVAAAGTVRTAVGGVAAELLVDSCLRHHCTWDDAVPSTAVVPSAVPSPGEVPPASCSMKRNLDDAVALVAS